MSCNKDGVCEIKLLWNLLQFLWLIIWWFRCTSSPQDNQLQIEFDHKNQMLSFNNLKWFQLISRLVFMMGIPTDVEDQHTIEEEHKLYGDIVQGSFIENYKNLTLKAIMGLKWVSQFCQEAPFIIEVWIYNL